MSGSWADSRLGPVLLPDWPAPPRVRALTTLRATGEPDWTALPALPQWLQQVHGAVVADLDHTDVDHTDLRTADAAVTARAGVVCAVRTADCLPVLLAATDGSAVAAAHAGWRGLAGGVLQHTVAALRLRASAGVALRAWLGPAIGPANFEVGDEVRAAFVQVDSAAEACFTANARGRWQCDLYALARQRLSQAGVSDVHGGGLCTYDDAQRFYSWRRARDAGRLASLIWLAPQL
jgi:polyphenol oxidase